MSAAVAYDLDPLTGLALRPGTNDALIIHAQDRAWRDLRLQPGDRVLDLGAHIGTFVWWAFTCHQPALEHVTCVEPDEVNFRLLRRNVARHGQGRVDLVRAAVVAAGSQAQEVPFYLSPKEGYLHSRLHKRGYAVRVAPAAPIDALVDQSRATVLKVDIEFGEYDALLDYQLPAHVTRLGIEFHLGRKEHRERHFPALVAHLRDQGFTPTRPANFATGWHVLEVCWER